MRERRQLVIALAIKSARPRDAIAVFGIALRGADVPFTLHCNPSLAQALAGRMRTSIE
jgi:hypothetical protein